MARRAPKTVTGTLRKNRNIAKNDMLRVNRLRMSARLITQMSLLRTWVISWASTPASSRELRPRRRPSVTSKRIAGRRANRERIHRLAWNHVKTRRSLQTGALREQLHETNNVRAA